MDVEVSTTQGVPGVPCDGDKAAWTQSDRPPLTSIAAPFT
jgi:hypothetical protein